MKKLMLFLALLLGAIAIHADDTADVKAVIDRQYQTIMQLDFNQNLSLFTKDCVITSRDGKKMTYADCKNLANQVPGLLKVADGKHIQEFFELTFIAQNQGKPLTAEQKKQIQATIQNEAVRKIYQQTCVQLNQKFNELKENCAAEYKSLKYTSIEINGNSAVLVFEAISKDIKTGKLEPTVNTIKMRKENGAWKICEAVETLKK